MQTKPDTKHIDLKRFIHDYYDSFIINIQPLIKEPLTNIISELNKLSRPPQESPSIKKRFIKLIALVPSNQQEDLISAFKQVCKESHYKTIALLLQDDLTVLKKYCIHFIKTFLNVHAPKICDEITYTEELLNILREKKLITLVDSENITRRNNSEGGTAALKILCQRITSRHPRWLPLFYAVLCEMNYLNVLEDIDKELYEKIELIPPKDSEEIIKCIEFHFETLAGEWEEKQELSEEEDSEEEDSEEEEDNDNEELKLFEYQMELVERALTGTNTIICAPTNSGKTYMATHIILKHLLQNTEGKVAFLVHRVALVEQQAKVLERYLKGFNFRVGRASGFMRDDINLPNLINTVDVLVMTAGILVNAFEERRLDKKIESITTFSLLVFDECHNCTGQHVYKQIMDRYLIAKPNQSVSRMPQVIGMTASFGTNKASDVEEAKNHILTIMANLDSYNIDMVRQNIHQLRTMLPEPISKFVLPQSRSSDNFESKLEEVMQLAESYLKTFQKKSYFKENEDISHLIASIPTDHSKSVYTSFVGTLKYLHHRAIDNREQRSDIIAIFEILDACNQAFKINRLFRAKDAVDHLSRYLQFDGEENKFSAVRSEIYSRIQQTHGLLDPNSWPTSNPVLDDVTERLETQFSTNPDSRVIIFVRERLYVTYLVNCFRDNGKFDQWGFEKIIGARNPNEDVKMTHTDQKRILEEFRKGKYKILFATNVIEEGLDVPECNLVIRYCHITNEVSMQQSKGRARAKNSEYLVIVPKGEEWIKSKEDKNVERKELEEEALAQILGTDFNTLMQKVNSKRVMKTYRPSQAVPFYDKSHLFSLRCRGCQLEICLNVNMKKYYNQHFFMVSEEKLQQLCVKYHDKESSDYRPLPGKVMVIGKIHCRGCQKKLGNIARTKEVAYPCFSLPNFSVRNLHTEKDYPAIKWRDCPFKVDDILTDEDIQTRKDTMGNQWLEDRHVESSLIQSTVASPPQNES